MSKRTVVKKTVKIQIPRSPIGSENTDGPSKTKTVTLCLPMPSYLSAQLKACQSSKNGQVNISEPEKIVDNQDQNVSQSQYPNLAQLHAMQKEFITMTSQNQREESPVPDVSPCHTGDKEEATPKFEMMLKNALTGGLPVVKNSETVKSMLHKMRTTDNTDEVNEAYKKSSGLVSDEPICPIKHRPFKVAIKKVHQTGNSQDVQNLKDLNSQRSEGSTQILKIALPSSTHAVKTIIPGTVDLNGGKRTFTLKKVSPFNQVQTNSPSPSFVFVPVIKDPPTLPSVSTSKVSLNPALLNPSIMPLTSALLHNSTVPANPVATKSSISLMHQSKGSFVPTSCVRSPLEVVPTTKIQSSPMLIPASKIQSTPVILKNTLSTPILAPASAFLHNSTVPANPLATNVSISLIHQSKGSLVPTSYVPSPLEVVPTAKIQTSPVLIPESKIQSTPVILQKTQSTPILAPASKVEMSKRLVLAPAANYKVETSRILVPTSTVQSSAVLTSSSKSQIILTPNVLSTPNSHVMSTIPITQQIKNKNSQSKRILKRVDFVSLAKMVAGQNQANSSNQTNATSFSLNSFVSALNNNNNNNNNTETNASTSSNVNTSRLRSKIDVQKIMETTLMKQIIGSSHLPISLTIRKGNLEKQQDKKNVQGKDVEYLYTEEKRNNFEPSKDLNKHIENCTPVENDSPLGCPVYQGTGTTFNISKKGEKVMVINPPLDQLVNDRDFFHGTLDRPCNNSQDRLDKHSYPANKLKPLHESQEMDLSCEWRIESVYSLSNDNPVIDDSDDTLSCDEFEQCDEYKTFSLKEDTWKSYCQPSYVVLDRLTLQNKSQDLKDLNISKCSNYCRSRAMNILCNLGLLDCKNSKAPVKTQQEVVDTDDRKELISASTLENQSENNSNQPTQVHLANLKDKEKKLENKELIFEEEFTQLRDEVLIKRNIMKEMKKLRKFIKIKQVPFEKLMLKNSSKLKAAYQMHKAKLKIGPKSKQDRINKTTHTLKQDKINKKVPSVPLPTSSILKNIKSTTKTNEKPQSSTNHTINVTAVPMKKNMTSPGQPLPLANTDANMSPLQLKYKKALDLLIANAHKLPYKDTNYFMVKVDNEQIWIKMPHKLLLQLSQEQQIKSEDTNTSSENVKVIAYDPKLASAQFLPLVQQNKESALHSSNQTPNPSSGSKIPITISSLPSPHKHGIKAIQISTKNANHKESLNPHFSDKTTDLKRPAEQSIDETTQRLLKRKRLEQKYPLPPGVIIKSEPISEGYELDNNWSVTTEIDTGYSQDDFLQDTTIPFPSSPQNDVMFCQKQEIISNENQTIDVDVPPLLESTSDWMSDSNNGREALCSDVPPILDPIFPSTIAVNLPDRISTTEMPSNHMSVSPTMPTLTNLLKLPSTDAVSKNNSTSVISNPAQQISEGGLDSSISTSSSGDLLAASLYSLDTSNAPQCTNSTNDASNVSQPKSRIEQLKDLLRKRQEQVEELQKRIALMPQTDLDSI